MRFSAIQNQDSIVFQNRIFLSQKFHVFKNDFSISKIYGFQKPNESDFSSFPKQYEINPAK